jgi:NADH:ubiquinone oxidoreductase subunit 5 (subunit L)/multisubunit Na+/H+ antiporter MnhA subunit
MLLFLAGMIHLVYTADLFLLYFSWEFVGLCSFFLVGFWYRQKEAAYGARKVLTMTHLAGYGLLVAVVLLHLRVGSTLWTDPRVGSALTTGIFGLILISVAAKSVQFPLYTWIPDAMAAPTPVSALLHAACYVKAGVYLIARLRTITPWPVSWGLTVSWLGAGTLLVGVFVRLGSARSQAAAGLPYRQPDRLHDARPGSSLVLATAGGRIGASRRGGTHRRHRECRRFCGTAYHSRR